MCRRYVAHFVIFKYLLRTHYSNDIAKMLIYVFFADLCKER